MKYLQSIPHQRKPQRMLNAVLVMFESAAGVVGRVNEHAFDTPPVLLLKRLQRQQVVTANEDIVEDIVVGNARLGVVGLVLIFQKDTGLQARTLILTNPRQFEALLAVVHYATPSTFAAIVILIITPPPIEW